MIFVQTTLQMITSTCQQQDKKMATVVCRY